MTPAEVIAQLAARPSQPRAAAPCDDVPPETDPILLLAHIKRTLRSGTHQPLPDKLAIEIHNRALALERDAEASIALAHDSQAIETLNRRRARDTEEEHAKLDRAIARWNLAVEANKLLSKFTPK